MPLNTQEDYERLGAHLDVIDAPLASFAAEYGYELYPKLSGGRYPNRRMTAVGRVTRSIRIGMEDTLEGKRYDAFFPTIPYSVEGTTWVDDHEQKQRWHGPAIIVRWIPFQALVPSLEVHLNHLHAYLCGVTEDYVLACGVVSPLGG